MSKNNFLRTFVFYLFLFNIALIFAYSFSYFESQIFIDNFQDLNLSRLEIFLIINLLTSFIYFLIDYVFQINDKITMFVSVYMTSFVSIIAFMWLIKFINLSRFFLLVNFLTFILSIFLFTRLDKKKTNDIYITFDKNMAKKNELFIFTDFNNFPQDFIKTVFEQLNSNNLKGLLYHEYTFKSLGFENIVELANFLGVDIFMLQDKKFKLLHSSSSLNNILKNFLDVVILILFSPIFLFLIIVFSVLVFLFDGTPIFYTQDRVGIKGRQFKIFKFRTMKKIKLTPEQIEELNEKSKVVFKSKKDPRITKFGSFLRKSSIDELPQIINILKNEMSFIGPRPPIPEEVLKYEIKHLKRVSVKPGITGLWQVTLRQDNDFDKWVEKDIEYIDNWSIFLDIKIALKTFKEIINLSGD